ncbi:MAG TPA: DUF4157 domain-containing protein [Thermoanaerobaculia bacterium]|nr:DUF4157 domain-containing protein [Thermoanaerobaculia bacterium]
MSERKSEHSATPEASPEPRRSSTSTQPLQMLLRRAGNNAVCGIVQAKLRVGGASVPLEEEAERAASTLGGGCCAAKPEGEQCDECNVRRKAIAPDQASADAPPSVDRALHGSGIPLDDATRTSMESHFDSDLSDVRVHTGGDASRSADEIGAAAYTSGRDIVFSNDGYQPHSGDGRRLLAHELTHVLQQRGRTDRTVRRQPAKPIPTKAVDDPCSISATSLTNAELISVFANTRNYVKTHKRGEDQLWYDHGNLLRRLASEVDRRRKLRHVWLGDESLTSMPGVLYELRGGMGNAIQIYPADVKAEAGAPYGDGRASVMTTGQFNAYLEKQQIKQIDAQEYFAKQDPKNIEPLTYMLPEPQVPKWAQGQQIWGPAASLLFSNPMSYGANPFNPIGMAGSGWGMTELTAFGGYPNPFGTFASKSASQGIYKNNANPATLSVREQSGGEVNWRGDIPEITTARSSWADVVIYSDLNKVKANFEVFDYRNRFSGDLVSVTHTLPDRKGKTSFNQYDTKFLRAINADQAAAEQAKFGRALQQLNQKYGTSTQVIDANEKTYLAINEDHVTGYRTQLAADVVADPGSYAPLLDALLRKDPVTFQNADGTRTTISTWNDLQNARATNAIPAGDFDMAIGRLSTATSQRVISNGITTTQLQVMQKFRAQNFGVPQETWSRSVAPELLDAMRYGEINPTTGLAEPNYAPMVKSAAKGGAVMGAGFSLLTDAVRFGRNPGQHPDMWREGLVDVGLGGLGGAGSASVESYVAARTSAALMGETGGGAAAMRILGRAGGGALGSLAAPVVTMASMALSSQDYTSLEYYGALGRSSATGAVGGIGGALATGTYFAIAGSEFPLVGNAIGFVVGFGGALIFDAIWGEDIDRGIREAGGELGCVDKAPPK